MRGGGRSHGARTSKGSGSHGRGGRASRRVAPTGSLHGRQRPGYRRGKAGPRGRHRRDGHHYRVRPRLDIEGSISSTSRLKSEPTYSLQELHARPLRIARRLMGLFTFGSMPHLPGIVSPSKVATDAEVALRRGRTTRKAGKHPEGHIAATVFGAMTTPVKMVDAILWGLFDPALRRATLN